MYKGMYIAASSAVMKMKQMEIVTNNMANAATYGFKQDGIGFRDFLVSEMNQKPQPMDGRDMTYVDKVFTDHDAGAMMETGNPLDVAINGTGFFSLEGGKYTRAGNFKLDPEGFLTTANGTKVLGEGGPIQLPLSAKVDIGGTGDILADGQIVDRLLIAQFDDTTKLAKVGDTAFQTDEAPLPPASSVVQGVLETSNVNIVKEMVSMINLNREYEMNSKMLQTLDDEASKVVNDMARM